MPKWILRGLGGGGLRAKCPSAPPQAVHRYSPEIDRHSGGYVTCAYNIKAGSVGENGNYDRSRIILLCLVEYNIYREAYIGIPFSFINTVNKLYLLSAFTTYFRVLLLQLVLIYYFFLLLAFRSPSVRFL